MKITSNTIISRYKILSEIGKGGMGEVYLAEDISLERKVAVKLLTHECCDDSERLRRFAQEAKTASALNHPNIITIFEFGKHEESHFMASEFVDGKELTHLIKKGIPVETIVEISIQIVSALKTAHEAGIIHRDIKPNNIMIRDDGLVKVLDFGLAKLVETGVENRGRIGEDLTLIAGTKADETDSPDRQLTVPGLVMGTPNYMSPEQARGRDIDHQTDIFSTGVVLYEMITGSRPFDGETVSDIIAAVLTKSPRPMSESNRACPHELAVIVEKALRKNKRERYQTAEEMLNDLNEIKQDLQVRDRLSRPALTNSSILDAAEISIKVNPQNGAKSSIAVLPFFDLSADDGNDYFSEGLTEEIIMNLSKLEVLKVVASGSTMHYKNEGKTHKQIAGDLGVQFLLEGSVRRHGENLRITAQLVDTAHQAYLWAETYRGTIDDIFEIQEKVAIEIARALEVHLSSDEKENLRKRYTENTEAYQLYLQGRFFWNKRNEQGVRTAIRYFESAIEKDNEYALAWAGIADSYSLLGEYGKVPRKELYPKAKNAAEKALEIDDRLAEAHTSLASILMLNDWDWANSAIEFESALRLNPNYATAHHWYALWFLCKGEIGKSLELISRGAELDPISQAIVKDKGMVLYYDKQYERAIELAGQTLELDPQYPAGRRLLSLAYQGVGRFKEAVEENRIWGELTGNEFEMKFGLAHIHAVSGKTQEAREILDEIEKGNLNLDNIFRGLALVYTALGDVDKAFDLLAKSCDLREESILNLKVDPKLDRLHGDQRFDALLKRIGIITQ